MNYYHLKNMELQVKFKEPVFTILQISQKVVQDIQKRILPDL